MLPLIEKEVVDRHRWAEKEEILDIFALTQSVPGSVGGEYRCLYRGAGFTAYPVPLPLFWAL